MLYRALSPLSKGTRLIARQGAVFSDKLISEDALKRLLNMGKVAPVSAPPLSALPGWEKRAETLQPHKITRADTFLEMDSAALAGLLSTTEHTVDVWKRDIYAWLDAPRPRNG